MGSRDPVLRWIESEINIEKEKNREIFSEFELKRPKTPCVMCIAILETGILRGAKRESM